MKQQFLLFYFVFFGLVTMQAQIGGQKVYQFLDLPTTARLTAMGGKQITVVDNDLSLAYSNPAALNHEMHHRLTFNHSFHLAEIGHGYAAFGKYYEKINTTFHAGVQYISYGDFGAADEFGNITGSFTADEYAIVIGAGKELYERLRIGTNIKLITSQLESYHSLGLVTDWAATYQVPEKRFTASLVFRNAGVQLTTFAEEKESVPFEISAGISKQLEHLPFRFSITAQHLQQWNLLYDDPNQVDEVFFFGEEEVGGNEWIDNFFRHLIFSGELLLGKKENFRVRMGYNHLRKKELSVANARSLAGFSGGLGFKVKWFQVAYGFGSHHLAGGNNHFSISTSLSEFTRKKE